ncbi:MAG TPA: hypothetical protein VL944_03245 [Candidatus Acidoferrum sp.]|nr:hypothetical protein [Candidatus Acidoferrum sp.]
MKTLYQGLISAAMRKYGIPLWLEPYLYKYAKNTDVSTIKQAISFINVRRKKGEVTGKYVKLPNGVIFDIRAVVHILNQFYYGVDATAKISEKWSKEYTDYDHANFTTHFKKVAAERVKHARALRNMIEGLGYKIEKPSREIAAVFSRIAGLDEWADRLIVTEIILRDAYSRPFGFIFYKVFYPVSPEFMRSLGKIFTSVDTQGGWAEGEIERVLNMGALTSEHVLALSEEILSLVYSSIQVEMPLAKKAHIEPEAMLLRDISVAYPLHTLADLGVKIDVDKEVQKVVKISKKGTKKSR